MKCDWCGKEDVTVQTGLFVSENGDERHGYICEKDHSDEGNPVFENKDAWEKWSEKHPTLANRIMRRGGPKYQYRKSGAGHAW